jgi:putative hydrolase of the HAD superfamily
MTGIRAVIFDLDDTLFAEQAYAFSGFGAVAAAFADRLGNPADRAARMRRLFESEHRSRVFDALLREIGLADDRSLVEDMVAVYRSHRPGIVLHADADRALDRLRSGFRLGLITDGPAAQQRRKIDALRVEPRLDELIVTSELGAGCGKPHPAAFEVMAERLGIPGPTCVYVADNQAKDFVAPNQLGWTTVRILRPDGIYRDVAPAPKGAAGVDVRSLDDIESVLT